MEDATLFILVGAEGMGEMNLSENDVEGVRKATIDEESAFRIGLAELCKNIKDRSPSDFFIDRTGRPYWLVAVTVDAPIRARFRAKSFKRVVRLFD